MLLCNTLGGGSRRFISHEHLMMPYQSNRSMPDFPLNLRVHSNDLKITNNTMTIPLDDAWSLQNKVFWW